MRLSQAFKNGFHDGFWAWAIFLGLVNPRCSKGKINEPD
jgi:hypothetical protein